ncbi:MAG: CHAD domain-containing protein [Cytophagaceae bacterium]|nr:CHAD domain-containing protein [Gemmatimonadaceae bacterium]
MATFPPSILETSEQRGIRSIALAMLADAERELHRLTTAPDEEALHDFRVAIRRLRSWLRAHGEAIGEGAPRRALRALRRVARNTNGRRDAEVLHAWLSGALPDATRRDRPGLQWLLAAVGDDIRAGAAEEGDVSTEFATAAETLREQLPLFQLTHHLDEGAREVPFAVALASVVRVHASQLERRLEHVHGEEDQGTLHLARIAGKRLRYILEPVSPHLAGGAAVITQLKAMQDALGALNDIHVWRDDLRKRFEHASAEEARRLAEFSLDDPAPRARRRRDLRPGLTAVADRLTVELQASQGKWAAGWSHAVREDFFGAVEQLALALAQHGIGGVEIERKYLLAALPSPLPPGEAWEIEQGYLPGERLVERLRHVRTPEGERWFRTMKSGRGVARIELEEETTREVFEAMWPLTLGKRVTKRRLRIPAGALLWEIDAFTDRDLVLAEVELRQSDEVVEIPPWLAPQVVREVTSEAGYVNANLAR